MPTTRPAFTASSQPLAAASGTFALLALVATGIVTSTALGADVQRVAVAGFVLTVLLVPLAQRVAVGGDLAPFLAVPTAISAFQNVYLLPVAARLAPGQIQLLIVVNVLFAGAALLVITAMRRRPLPAPPRVRAHLTRRTVWLFVIVAGYGAVTMVAFRADPTSALASFRNIATPFLFLLLGLLAAPTTRVRTYAACVVVIGVVTVAFGFVEDNVPGFWQSAGLARLWEAKGLGVAVSTGLPANFYSSELIGDRPLRRMASSFADPVNFGTFVFAAFMLAWFLRRRLLVVLFVLGAAFAVSKGAFLGILVFVALWSWQSAPRWFFWLTAAAVAVVGVQFYGFSATSSTGSTDAHIGGFLAAFTELPAHPFGRGLGNVGVLAGLFDDGGSDSEVRESGIGMIVGQLGVVGLVVFVVFFVLLFRATRTVADPRSRLLARALLLGFLVNAMFNEVALSPNSAAPYFIALGLVLGRTDDGRTLPDPRTNLIGSTWTSTTSSESSAVARGYSSSPRRSAALQGSSAP